MGEMFSHGKAQKYEIRAAKKTIRNNFREVYEYWKALHEAGGVWRTPDDLWFQGDIDLFDKFVSHVTDRKCLEIDCGPFGYLPTHDWIKDRTVIDPLVDVYREEEMRVLGKTFFTEDIKTLAQNAEVFVETLSGVVDGCIVCQNALDHCEDPLLVLHNIGRYATPGCFLLLWTDIWCLRGSHKGHRNITRSETAMDALLKGLGFAVLKRAKKAKSSSSMAAWRKNPPIDT